MVYTFLSLAEDILKTSDKPMTYQEIWEKGNEQGLHSKVRISGKTPWRTLGARLYVDVKDNENSIFIKASRVGNAHQKGVKNYRRLIEGDLNRQKWCLPLYL
ncbi:MAG: winged helix-turn-helix domain-containing protein [Deltaproteobacteria bacterium]|nr:winged helix-turn-helix domain-containing protein [Deltaproteobacteria bacterium]